MIENEYWIGVVGFPLYQVSNLGRSSSPSSSVPSAARGARRMSDEGIPSRRPYARQ